MLIINEAHRLRFPFVLHAEGDPSSESGGGGESKPPQFVPAEEFKQFQATMTGFMDTMKSTMEGFAAIAANRRDDTPAPPAKEEITAETYADAIADPGAEGARKVIAQYEREREARLGRRMEERVAGMEQTGIGALTTISREQMKLARDPKGGALYPHFARFEKQIEDRVKTLHPSLRAQPEAWLQVYKNVVGENIGILLDEERERVLRTPDTKGSGEPPAAAAGRDKGAKEGPPSVRDVGGEEAEKALTAAGKDPDGMARRMGYKSWEDYVTKNKDYINV